MDLIEWHRMEFARTKLKRVRRAVQTEPQCAESGYIGMERIAFCRNALN